jgi:hypothetical protein
VIRVQPKPEPPDFDEKVRQPGLRAQKEIPPKAPPLWRGECLRQLWEAYEGICSYLCIFIQPGIGDRSVDHFVPRSRRPELLYEWSNYRLACSLMNSRKRQFEDVLDPFEVEDGWFVLDLSFLQVLPNPDLDEETRRRVQATIDRLDLNDSECLQARANDYDAYLRNELSLDLLKRWSPFVAREMRRQGLAAL